MAFFKKKAAEQYTARNKYLQQVKDRQTIVNQLTNDPNLPQLLKELYQNNYDEEVLKAQEVQDAITAADAAYKAKEAEFEQAKAELLQYATDNVDWAGSISYAKKGASVEAPNASPSLTLLYNEEQRRHADLMKNLSETILIAKAFGSLATPLPTERVFRWSSPHYPGEQPKSADKARKPKKKKRSRRW